MSIDDSRMENAVREPLQDRSRDAWERVLQAGLSLLIEHGRSAITVQAICERAQVSRTAIYARVDGITELFWVLYERGFDAVRITYREAFAEVRNTPAASRERVSATVDALWRTFSVNLEFLKPIITQAVSDPVLLQRGAVDSAPFVSQIADLISLGDDEAAGAVARTLMAEANFRVVFGAGFLVDPPESEAQFRDRLVSLAWSRLISA